MLRQKIGMPCDYSRPVGTDPCNAARVQMKEMTVVDIDPADEGRQPATFKSSIIQREGFRGKISHLLQVSSSNKVSQRVFRSFQAIQWERQRQRRESPFIIHPFSQFRWYWDLVMVVTLGVTLLVLPVEVAFYSDNDGHSSNTWMSINMIVDIIFMVDIAFNFRTGYIHTGVDQVEINSKKVALNYLKTWFIIDLISSTPLDYLYRASTGGNQAESFFLTLRILRFTKLLSLLRILRVARLVRYIYKIEELLEMDGKLISIVNLVMVIFVFCHWNGCLQYLAAFLEGFPENSWVIQENMMTISGNSTERIVSIWTMYTRSLWRAMSHMLSIGYGALPPVTNVDTWMVILSMMLGASFYALFIASMSGLIMSMDLSGKKYDEMISEVKQYMRFRRVPIKLQQRVLEYYDHKYQRKYFDESTILYEPSMLSHNLRQEILLHNCRPLVAKVPFLSTASPDFLYDIIRKLQFQVFFPGDIIIQAGKEGDGMYFIEHGLVEIQTPEGKVINSLGDGSYFGEIALMNEGRRVATVVSIEICDLYCLKKMDFDNVLREYPEMKIVLKTIVAQRMNQLKQGSSQSKEKERPAHAIKLTDNIPVPEESSSKPETEQNTNADENSSQTSKPETEQQTAADENSSQTSKRETEQQTNADENSSQTSKREPEPQTNADENSTQTSKPETEQETNADENSSQPDP